MKDTKEQNKCNIVLDEAKDLNQFFLDNSKTTKESADVLKNSAHNQTLALSTATIGFMFAYIDYDSSGMYSIYYLLSVIGFVTTIALTFIHYWLSEVSSMQRISFLSSLHSIGYERVQLIQEMNKIEDRNYRLHNDSTSIKQDNSLDQEDKLERLEICAVEIENLSEEQDSLTVKIEANIDSANSICTEVMQFGNNLLFGISAARYVFFLVSLGLLVFYFLISANTA